MKQTLIQAEINSTSESLPSTRVVQQHVKGNQLDCLRLLVEKTSASKLPGVLEVFLVLVLFVVTDCNRCGHCV